MSSKIVGVNDYASVWVVVYTRTSFVLHEERVCRSSFFSEEEAIGYLLKDMREQFLGNCMPELSGNRGRISTNDYEMTWEIERYDRVSE